MTQAEVKPFKRQLRPGRTSEGDVFVAVEWDGARLSLSGVEGPLRNGDARGGAGQITEALDRITELGEGWGSHVTVVRLRQLWERWHLNDMRPGCEHQRADGWGERARVEVQLVPLTWGAKYHEERRKAESGSLTEGEYAEYRKVTKAVYAVTITSKPSHPDLYGAAATRLLADGYLAIDEKRKETKAAGWVRPSEHPQGLLTKPCETCGYKYGTEWKPEPVPAEVLAELQAMPEADKPNPWGSA